MTSANHTRNSDEWDKVGEIEDCMAMLAGLELLRAQIEHKALFEQGYDDIHELAVKMIEDLRKIKLQLKRVRDLAAEIARKTE